ncbi:VOC family protein [Corynebacterium pacaense]|uniref:VOC family protein n=1 Tax=Corynebacterium pacaense TaxID=1816684 RepID=UPI0009BA9979|nr:VOC family protein [Corynebacterium pacaense]
MQTIIPAIWCQGTADEMAQFYLDAFSTVPGGAEVLARRTYPETGLLDFQRPLAGKTLTVQLRIGNMEMTLINAGGEFTPNPSIGIMLNFDPSVDKRAARNLDAVWDSLAPGGRILIERAEYPFSPRYGWVEDRFGVSWQFILTRPEGDPRPFAMISLLFPSGARGDLARAERLWTSVIPASEIGRSVEEQGAVVFSEFRLGGQWLTAMDSTAGENYPFTPGVSMMYTAHGQAEIDRVWEALSAVPDAEQCGWLCDEFGVSWQIVPDNMEQLLDRPGGFTRMLEMKKIEIDGFR